MKYIPFVFLSVLFIYGCGKKKTYTYIEIQQVDRIYNVLERTKQMIIEAPNDSVAYSIAYHKFLTSKVDFEKISNKVREGLIDTLLSKPQKFNLINEEGKDISSASFLKNPNDLHEKIRTDVISSLMPN